MSGGVRAYLDACRDITEAQWLDISEDGNREQADFWTIAQVVPGELREAGDRFAQRWLDSLPPESAMECWFRRVVCRWSRPHVPPVEPWVILYAIGHAMGGMNAPSPKDYARTVNMPIAAERFQDAVSIARKTAPADWEPENWFARCNR